MMLHRALLSTALGLVLAAGTGAAFAQDEQNTNQQATNQSGQQQMNRQGDRSMAAMNRDRVDLAQWDNRNLYEGGRSVQAMIETLDVNGVADEDIGELEDLVIGTDGKIVAAIVEIGGFLDIGDTHIAVPWDEVEINAAGDGINVPVNDDNIGEYTLFDRELIQTGNLSDQMLSEVDDAMVGERAYRASELIGDYARIQYADTWRDYGYVSDIIVKNDEVVSVIVTPDVTYGTAGYYAMPYYGYGSGYGFSAGMNRYNMPYEEVEIADLEPFEYDEMDVRMN